MLASIHPLGERARGQSFIVTVIAYALGSVTAAAAFGAALGALGDLLLGGVPDSTRLGLLAIAAVAAALVDRSGRRIPSWRRQVNEDWLTEYRGWVYGAGFGAQLGLGVVTIVTTAAVYLTWVGAFAVASWTVGLIVGAAFGLARAVPMLASGRMRTPDAVGGRVGRIDAWAGRFQAVTVTAEATAGLLLAVFALR